MEVEQANTYQHLNIIAERIKSGHIKNIVLLTGAGMSVAAGIPDFRSPGGMYDTLRPELLTATEKQIRMMRADPTKVVSAEIFLENQFCYLELRRPFILGLAEKQWKATISHFFVRLCYDKGLLRRLYTQNIDGLDFQTGVPTSKLTTVHGTMGKIKCEFCSSTSMELDQFRELVKRNIKDIYKQDPTAPLESTHILCPDCNSPGLKPATVLYGSSLPEDFHTCCEEDFPSNVDLFICAGTSLTVSPANNLVRKVSKDCIRLIVNREPVGAELGIQYGQQDSRDIHAAGSCDEAFLALIKLLGWENDLLQYKHLLAPASLALLEAQK